MIKYYPASELERYVLLPQVPLVILSLKLWQRRHLGKNPGCRVLKRSVGHKPPPSMLELRQVVSSAFCELALLVHHVQDVLPQERLARQ